MSLIRQIVIQDPNDPTRLAVLDELFNVLVGIDVAHREVHEGDSFLCGYADTAMGNTDSFVIAFKTPVGTKRIHLIYSFDTLAGGHLDIYKNSTWDPSSGALLPIYNRFQTDTPDSSAVLEDQSTGAFIANDNMILDPTTHAAGDKVIPTHYAFGKNQVPASARAEAEIVLEVDTLHSVVFVADGVSNAGQVLLNWYEHTDD